MAQIVFMGTPEFAVPVLKALIDQHTVIGVVTQPDRPAGRKQRIQQSPVKQAALEAGIPVFQPERLRGEGAVNELKRWSPDAYVVAAFGQILSQAVLDIPRCGSINVHASLLPRWRGAAPIQAAIRAGDAESGITIMLMDAGLDTGPILTQQAIPLSASETGQSLHDKLSVLGAELLIKTLPGYLSGEIAPKPQDDLVATYAPQIKKEEGQIDWGQNALTIERLVRAFTPWPGTYTSWGDKQLKVCAGRAVPGDAEPGLVVEYDGHVQVGTADGLFLPSEVQLEGKKRLTIEDFIRGHGDFVGSRLGS